MKHFIVLDADTRIVLRSGQCQDDDLELQAAAGEIVIEGVDADILTLRQPGDFTVSEQGEISQRAKTLAELKQDKWAAVKRKRSLVAGAGITIPNIGTFQTDEASMNNINQAVSGVLLAASQSLPFTISWTLADNSVAVLDGPTMAAVGKLAGERKAACYARSQVLWGLIQAAANEAELDAIDITTGWPA